MDSPIDVTLRLSLLRVYLDLTLVLPLGVMATLDADKGELVLEESGLAA